MADASSNPYTTVAAVLQASRLGVQNGYALPPMETGDGFDRTDAREGTAIDLKGAVVDLEADSVLAEAIGAKLVANHVYMKRKEVRKTRDLEGEALRDFYVHFI